MRASEYPCPDYACYIWHRGDALMLALPDLDGHGNGRTLAVPLEKCFTDAPGLRFVLDLLAERRRVVSEGRKPFIGTKGAPTAMMLEQALKASRKLRASQELGAQKAQGASRTIDEDLFATETDETNVQQEETVTC